jgi:orotate phosphoribosyltransferase
MLVFVLLLLLQWLGYLTWRRQLEMLAGVAAAADPFAAAAADHTCCCCCYCCCCC